MNVCSIEVFTWKGEAYLKKEHHLNIKSDALRCTTVIEYF